MKTSPEEIAHTLLCSLGIKSGIAYADAVESHSKGTNPELSSSYRAASSLLREMWDSRNNEASTNPA